MSGKSQQKSLLEQFIHSESASSIVLILATALALAWANSPWADYYRQLAHLDVGAVFHGVKYHLTLDHWVKDGLMVVFFFVVGLEIKRELLIGELSTKEKALLPVMAAVGGAVLPALIYLLFNRSGEVVSGWGVPMATDIAFALGVLALFGKRVPIGLKVFLTALAIVDDLLAVLVIALFYTEQVHFLPLAVAALLLVLLALLARKSGSRPVITALLIVGVWLGVFLSGVHATIAGVLLAMVVPVRATIEPEAFFATVKEQKARLREGVLTRHSMVENKAQLDALQKIHGAAEQMLPAGYLLERRLHPIQSFLILPLFALFAAGVTMDAAALKAFPGGVGLGIMMGLVAGKQIGILGGCLLAVRGGLAALPAGVTWPQVWGVSLLGGIGFTMSIFVSELAFADPALLTEAKIAVFAASLLAGVAGAVVLSRVLPRQA